MTFNEQINLAQHGDFKRQVKMAIIKSALDTVGEAPASSPANIPLDDARHDLGVQILDDILFGDSTLLIRFAYACAANNNLVADQASNSDADVQFTVNTIYDDMAGVSGAVVGA